MDTEKSYNSVKTWGATIVIPTFSEEKEGIIKKAEELLLSADIGFNVESCKIERDDGTEYTGKVWKVIFSESIDVETNAKSLIK